MDGMDSTRGMLTDLTTLDLGFKDELVVGFDLGDLFTDYLDLLHELFDQLLILGIGQVLEMDGFAFIVGSGVREAQVGIGLIDVISGISMFDTSNNSFKVGNSFKDFQVVLVIIGFEMDIF